jgi:hypothetical protein
MPSLGMGTSAIDEDVTRTPMMLVEAHVYAMLSLKT